MLKYLIYLAIALLVFWSVFYVVRQIRRQMRGNCASCGDCNGACGSCKGESRTCKKQ